MLNLNKSIDWHNVIWWFGGLLFCGGMWMLFLAYVLFPWLCGE